MPRSEYAHIRLEPEERRVFDARASHAALSLSDYLRVLLGLQPIGKRDKRSRKA